MSLRVKKKAREGIGLDWTDGQFLDPMFKDFIIILNMMSQHPKKKFVQKILQNRH